MSGFTFISEKTSLQNYIDYIKSTKIDYTEHITRIDGNDEYVTIRININECIIENNFFINGNFAYVVLWDKRK